MKNFNNIKLEIKNLKQSKNFLKFMMALDCSKDYSRYDNLLNMCQNGYCEDLCVYFYFKYRNIKIINVNNEHFIFKYKDRYYDSLSPIGVKTINKIPFFKNKDITSIRVWKETELPKYYRQIWNRLKHLNEI